MDAYGEGSQLNAYCIHIHQFIYSYIQSWPTTEVAGHRWISVRLAVNLTN